MTIWTTRIFVIGAILLAPVSAVHATVVDFTSNAWSGTNGTINFVGPGITLSSAGGNMTFNSSDGATGCGSGGDSDIESETQLDCTGDGIGIAAIGSSDDEITQGGKESLTVTFTNGPVNIHSIDLLDLFAREISGEKAVITWATGSFEAHADPGSGPPIPYNRGGYWEVNEGSSDYDSGLTMAGITSFTLTGFGDHFSDYSLARIEFSAVPVPAAFWMFGTALIGFVAMSRRIKV